MTTDNLPAVARPLSPAEVTWKTAQKIANTPFVPTAFRGKPESVFAAILYGEELGLGPMQSLNSIHVIEGKPSMSPELMRGLVARAGHRIDVKESSSDKVTVWGKRIDTGSEATVTWSMKDAQLAGLAGRGAWKTYPRAMLLARATSELCRMLFADVVAGLSYTPEEAASIAGVEWTDVPADPLSSAPQTAIQAPIVAPQEPITEAVVADPEPVVEVSWEDAFPEAEIVDAEVIEPAPAPKPKPAPRDPNAAASPKQFSMIFAIGKKAGLGAEDMNKLAQAHLNRDIDSFRSLTMGEASSFIDYLQQLAS